MSVSVAPFSGYLERERLKPDLNRAMRCTVGFMGPMLAAYWWHLPVEASYAAIAAQNIALVDIRGSYPLRLSLLLTMTAMLAGSTWLGSVTGAHLALALGAVVLLMLAGGLWRHLSAEYGPSLATSSALLFLIALAHPNGEQVASRYFLAALAGGLWGVLVQVGLWPFRAQHPLRRTVADSWLALADLLAAMAPDATVDATSRHELIAERQAQLRTALDHATELLAAAPVGGKRPYLRQLEVLNMAAARIATRFMAFNTSLETLMERPDFSALAPSFGPVLTSLTNTTRTIALTVVSRQPSHLAACEVRLRRLGHLLNALQGRVLSQTGRSPDGAQMNFILQQIAGLLPGIHDALRATIDRADERAAFSLELFDLQTWTLRPLASALNLQWRPDGTLVRFIARATVVLLIGVAIFKYFGLERGYWLPLTTLVVLQPDYGSTRLRAGQRVIGTLAGSVLASLLLWLSLPPAVLLAAMAVTMAGFAFWLKRNYAIAVFFITLFVVLITEVSTKVTVAFTVERLAATAAGGLLALLAALLFWPVWERQRFPAILARALRVNRDFVRILGERLAAGGSYDAVAASAKRAAEVANSVVFASLQRMSGDPKNQQAGLEEAAALANGNQRLTRAFTVVAVHLTPGTPLARPELAGFVRVATETLEALALAAETEQPDANRLAALRVTLDELDLAAPKTATTMEHGVYSQFARCVTELSAMLLAIPFPAAANKVPGPEAVS
jgi:uncharacterized membrane protein YccC